MKTTSQVKQEREKHDGWFTIRLELHNLNDVSKTTEIIYHESFTMVKGDVDTLSMILARFEKLTMQTKLDKYSPEVVKVRGDPGETDRAAKRVIGGGNLDE